MPPLFLVYEGETHHRDAERKHLDSQQEETNTRQGVPRLGTFHVLQGIDMDLGFLSKKSLDAENTCLHFNTVHFVCKDSLFIQFFPGTAILSTFSSPCVLLCNFLSHSVILIFLLCLVVKLFPHFLQTDIFGK
jgi:hypothetical protein